MSEQAAAALAAWNWEPSVLIGTAVLVILYLAARGPWRSRFPGARPVERGQTVCFLLGVLIPFFALVSPLDDIGDHYLFSVHMVQHLLLTLVAAPLLILGTPGWMLRPLLRYRFVATPARLLTMPLVAFAVFNLNFMLWHLPALYESTLENEGIHILEHLVFIGTAVLNWWPILSPLPELPRLPYPGQILYLFLDAIPSTVLGGLFVFASDVLYPTYAAAPRVFGVSAMDDQMASGLIMAMPGGMTYLLALTIVFFVWMGREERAERGGTMAE